MRKQPERRVDKVFRTIAAPSSEIYQTILNPEALVKWLPPTGMTGQIDAYEPRESGDFQVTLAYVGEEYAHAGKTADNKDVMKGTFLKLVPNQQIVWGGKFESEDVTLQEPMSMTWQLDAVSAETTKVTLMAENVPETIKKQDHEDGLNSTLENLEAYLAKAKD